MSNPTDDWDDRGDDTSSQPTPANNDEGWGDWGDQSEQQPAKSSDDDWGDWSGTQSDTSQQTESSNDGWGDWGSSSQQNGGFINPNQSDDNFIDPSQDDSQSWANQPQDYQTQQVTEPPIKTNFSTKTIAFIVAGGILVVALLLMGIDKVHINKKDTTNTNTNTTVVQEEQRNTGGSSSQQEQSNQVAESQTSMDSAVLVEIPNSTSMTYSNDTLKANGKVTDKKKYVQGKQIVYCVEITIAVGSSSETVNYYCTSATFNQIGKGDILIVNYVQVDDSYISITNVEK